MKVNLKYLLVISLLTVMMFSLTACSNEEENPIVENEEIEEVVEEKEIQVSDDYTKWPAGVYDVYGIPEYTTGTFAFAEPNSESGYVLYETTYSEFKSYIDSLIDKGFRISEDDKEKIDNYDPTSYIYEDGLSGTICAPEKGEGYVLKYSYDENPSTANVYASDFGLESFNDGSDSMEYTCNMSLRIEKAEYTEKKTDKDVFVKYGISDEDAIPKFEYHSFIKDNDSDGYTLVSLNFGYDGAVSRKDITQYMIQLQKACIKIADDGKLYNYSQSKEIEIVEEGVDSAFTYKYQGKSYRVLIELHTGFGENTGIVIEEV